MCSTRRSNDLYDLLAPDVRGELARNEKAKTVPAATVLMSRGTFPDNLIILDAGSVEIAVRSGEQTISRVVQEGGKLFGLREILGHTAADADVVCRSECQVTLLPEEDIRAILEQHPEIYAALTRILSTEVRMANNLLRRLPPNSAR